MAQFSFFTSLLSWLTRRTASFAQAPSPAPTSAADQPYAQPVVAKPEAKIAWGAKVTDDFKRKTITISRRLNMDPSHLMAIMAFETSRSFDPSITNRAGSGATGLIQFMPATARDLGTTTSRLALMNAVEQLDYVERYCKTQEQVATTGKRGKA